MSSGGRKTKVQQTWERSFAGFGELSSSAGTILSNSSTAVDSTSIVSDVRSATVMTFDGIIDSELNHSNSVPPAGSVTPPCKLSGDVFSVPETPRCGQTSATSTSELDEEVYRICDESQIEISTQSHGVIESHDQSTNTQQSLDSFLNHILNQYGSQSESFPPTKPLKRKPKHSLRNLNAKTSVPRKKAKVTRTLHLSKNAVNVPHSPGIDKFLNGIFSSTKHYMENTVSSTQLPDNRVFTSQEKHTDTITNSVEFLNRSEVKGEEDEKSFLLSIPSSQKSDILEENFSEFAKDEISQNYLAHCGDPLNGDRHFPHSEVRASPSHPLIQTQNEVTLGNKSEDSQHLFNERITHIIPSPSVVGSERPVYSQFIESECGALAINQSVLSQPSISSQIITCLESSLNSEDCETDGNVVWTPLSIASANQTPDIHNKVEEIVNKTRTEIIPFTSVKRRKLVKGGLAEAMNKVIKRDRSNYVVCRHAVTLQTPALTCSQTSKDTSFKAVVIRTSDQVVIRCHVIDGDIKLRGECYLITNSLTQEGHELNTGDEIMVYHPWRVKDHPDLGTVIFTTSYCDVTKINDQSDNSKSEKVVSSVLIGHQTPQGAESSQNEKHPKYKGPYAFLYQ